MSRLAFVVPGSPVPCARARVFGGGGHRNSPLLHGGGQLRDAVLTNASRALDALSADVDELGGRRNRISEGRGVRGAIYLLEAVGPVLQRRKTLADHRALAVGQVTSVDVHRPDEGDRIITSVRLGPRMNVGAATSLRPSKPATLHPEKRCGVGYDLVSRMRPQLPDSGSSRVRMGADGKTYTVPTPTPEQEARAMLLAAVDVCRANEARCVEEAEQLAELAYEISIQSGDKVREATKWRDAMIDFACQYGQRVDEQTDEECACPSCSAEGRP